MIILGLTGSIGMGKSTVAAMLKRLRIPVHEADAAVHRALAPGGAGVKAVAALFPQALKQDAKGHPFIDRAVLGKAAFADKALLKKLEAILHPRVRLAEKKFLQRARAQRRRLVVLDIPLLFETGAQKRVDKVVVVTAPAFLQRQRVLARPGMNTQKLEAILCQQMPDAEKRKRADGVVPTGLGRAVTLRVIRRVTAAFGKK